MTGNGIFQRFGAGAAALAALGAFARSAAAGEAAPKSVDSPLDRPQFEWVAASRDPFEYRPRRTRVEPETDSGRRSLTEILTGQGTKTGNGDGKNGNGGRNGESAAQTLLNFILGRIRDAELRLSLREYAEAAKLATEGLSKIAPGQDPERKLIEKLERLRDTAQRLDDRAKIEKSFSELPISVEGIVWAPGKAVALINGKVRSPGQKVEGVTIDEIRRGEVIFVLKKGVRVRKRPLGAGAD